MKKLKFILIFLLVSGVFLSAKNQYSTSESIGLLGGSNSGTYIKIARDIKEITKGKMNIEVYNGGSLENIEKVLKDRDSQFAIVQYDALLYREKILGDRNLRNKIKMIFPLYNEEIHLIVRKDRGIYKIDDLEGKKVNMDKRNSGCWVTATMIKKFRNLEWREFNYPPKEALMKLISGDIDAFIYVVGQPAPILAKLPASSKEVIKLISPEVSNFYPETVIKKESYKWLDRDVKTNTTKALLITYNYNEKLALKLGKRVYYYMDNIKKLSKIIYDNLSYLRANRHPKWKEINPYDTQGVKWPIHPLVSGNSGGSAISKCEQLKNRAEIEMCRALQEQ